MQSILNFRKSKKSPLDKLKNARKRCLSQLIGIPNFLLCVFGVTNYFWLTFGIVCANALVASVYYLRWRRLKRDVDSGTLLN